MSPRLTAAGRDLLDATSRGRVTYWPGPGIVIRRHENGQVDVSEPFGELMRGRWALVEPYDLEFPPSQVPCTPTEAGEDALMDAARKKEGARR